MDADQIQQQAHQAVRQIREGRRILGELLQHLGSDALISLILNEEGVGEEIVPTRSPKVVASTANVGRSAVSARTPRVVNGRPSLPWAMQIIIKEAGRPLSGTEVFEGLKERNWVPNSKNPRAYVSRILSGSPQVFVRDAKLGRGHYDLPSGFQVPDLPKDMTATKATNGSATTKTNGATTNGSAKTAVKTTGRDKRVFPAVVEMLQHTRKPIAFVDVSKATGLPAKPVQGILISLLRLGALKRTKNLNEEGKKLFEIDREAFNTLVKKSEARTAAVS